MMIIKFPKVFEYPNTTLKDNILYINDIKNFDYEDFMRYLLIETYPHNCIYCGKKLQKSQISVDHLYPRGYGGISIPENMAISCSNCNSRKSDLTKTQYLFMLRKNSSALQNYLLDSRKLNENLKKQFGFILPNTWVTYLPTSCLQKADFSNLLLTKKICKIYKFYSKYKKLPYLVILDKNYNVLRGFSVYCFSLRNNIPTIPAIILENIITKTDSSS